MIGITEIQGMGDGLSAVGREAGVAAQHPTVPSEEAPLATLFSGLVSKEPWGNVAGDAETLRDVLKHLGEKLSKESPSGTFAKPAAERGSFAQSLDGVTPVVENDSTRLPTDAKSPAAAVTPPEMTEQGATPSVTAAPVSVEKGTIAVTSSPAVGVDSHVPKTPESLAKVPHSSAPEHPMTDASALKANAKGDLPQTSVTNSREPTAASVEVLPVRIPTTDVAAPGVQPPMTGMPNEMPPTSTTISRVPTAEGANVTPNVAVEAPAQGEAPAVGVPPASHLGTVSPAPTAALKPEMAPSATVVPAPETSPKGEGSTIAPTRPTVSLEQGGLKPSATVVPAPETSPKGEGPTIAPTRPTVSLEQGELKPAAREGRVEEEPVDVVGQAAVAVERPAAEVLPVAPGAPTGVAAAQSVTVTPPTAPVPQVAQMVAAAEAVIETLSVSAALAATGEGEIRLQLKQEVLDGSSIRLMVKGGDLKILVTPATRAAEESFVKHQEAFQTHLAERVTNWRISVGVSLWGARALGNYRSEDEV